LATRPTNSIGSNVIWENAEQQLKQALTLSGRKWDVKEGDGAFYGPKIDI
jgi:threonyl-tRNA synthetase